MAEREIWSDRFENYYYLTVQLADISTASSCYVPIPHDGYVTKIYSVINGAIGTADCVITAYKGGTALTNGVITVATSGSAAGDVDSCTPTAGNNFTAGQMLTITTGGQSTNTVIGVFTIEVKKNRA